ncbi:MAG: hypothetical protein ACXAB7_11375, partial [Candidatus Kariarchaeaceae archaeon]
MEWVILFQSILMFIISALVFILGKKRGTYNLLLWTAIPLIRGFHWLLEFFLDWIEDSGRDFPFFLERTELALGFLSSMFILAACFEFNDFVPSPYGKLVAGSLGVPFFYFLFVLSEDNFVLVEDQEFFSDFVLTSDPYRIVFGLAIPLIASMVLLIPVLITLFSKGKQSMVYQSTSSLKTTILLGLVLIPFSIFEGFDNNSGLYNGMRSVSLAIFSVLPLLVIYSTNLGLYKFFIIESSGIP